MITFLEAKRFFIEHGLRETKAKELSEALILLQREKMESYNTFEDEIESARRISHISNIMVCLAVAKYADEKGELFIDDELLTGHDQFSAEARVETMRDPKNGGQIWKAKSKIT